MKLRNSLYSRFLGSFLLFAVIHAPNGLCQETPIIKPGDHFPEIQLRLPLDSLFGEYLGIAPNQPFSVKDIHADLVLVEVMNINCGSCQKQAPVYNDLFDKIQSSPDYKDRIKMMAIGAGNQDEFIKKYQDHFKAPYPIVEDPALDLYTAIGKSPVPLALYVRIDKTSGKAWVMNTHTGFQNDPQAIFDKMTSLLGMEARIIQQNYAQQENTYVKVRSVITEDQLMDKIKQAFQLENVRYTEIEKITLTDGRTVYVGQEPGKSPAHRIFARLVSQPPPCDLCHDAHYIYVFDKKGKILQFIPVRLSKYGNKAWTPEDVQTMKHRLEGRFIHQPFQYDAKVDAITSATITSLVVIQSLNEGKSLFDELRTLGWVD